MIKWHTMFVALIFSMVLLYVWQLNHQAANSFSIKDLELTRDSVQQEIADLTWKISDARSLATVRQRADELKLQSPREISFLHVGLSTVAVAEETIYSP